MQPQGQQSGPIDQFANRLGQGVGSIGRDIRGLPQNLNNVGQQILQAPRAFMAGMNPPKVQQGIGKLPPGLKSAPSLGGLKQRPGIAKSRGTNNLAQQKAQMANKMPQQKNLQGALQQI